MVSENGKVTTLDGPLAGSDVDIASAVRHPVQLRGLGLKNLTYGCTLSCTLFNARLQAWQHRQSVSG
jgi:hypothetical protein